MWNVTTNWHPRPLVYRFDLTDRERAAMGYTEEASEEETTEYVRYRGAVIPVSDFTTTALRPGEFGGAWDGVAEFRAMGWDGYVADSYSTCTVLRYAEDYNTGDRFGYVIVGRAWLCDCTEEDGPCSTHSDEIAQRVGSSNRSADELCAVFLSDAADALTDAGAEFPAEWADIRALVDNPESWDGSWLADGLAVPNASDGYSASDALRDAVSAAEDALGAVGLCTYWDDGFRILRLTGGPLVNR